MFKLLREKVDAAVKDSSVMYICHFKVFNAKFYLLIIKNVNLWENN